MSYHDITLTLNGVAEKVTVPSHMTLLQMLREKLALTGTKTAVPPVNAAPARCW